MRPPVCEICDANLDPADGAGGLVTFQPDDHSRDWRRRAAEEPGFVGHPPDTGWFCAAHIDAARDAARTLTLPEGMRRMLAGDDSVDTTAPSPDPAPDLATDLVGIELGSGRAVVSDVYDLRWVEWTLPPTDAHVLAASLRASLPALFEALGLGPAPALEQRTERRWTPMDGALPPWCPFTDTTVDAGVGADGTSVDVEVVLNHWNDDEVANAAVSLMIGDRLAISAFRANGTSREVDTLRLRRPTTAAALAVVATLAH